MSVEVNKLKVHSSEIDSVGVWLGAERCTEEFSRLNTDECVLTSIFILVA